MRANADHRALCADAGAEHWRLWHQDHSGIRTGGTREYKPEGYTEALVLMEAIAKIRANFGNRGFFAAQLSIGAALQRKERCI